MNPLVVLVIVNLGVISCEPLFHRGRPFNKHGMLGIPVARSQPFESVEYPKEQWFEQRLNHFDPVDTRTWKQRYFVNDTFFASGGPVFLQLGGEGEASPVWVVEGQIATNYAKKFNAMSVLLEHRYYGQSHPTPDMSDDNLRYLTSEQALQDAAYFIEYLNSKLSLANSKWVVFGGSYSGSLAAWFRAKYPHLVVGAIASSAPIEAVVNFKEYLGVVSRSLGQRCDDSIREATAQLAQELERPLGWRALEKQFKLCDPFNGTNTNDVYNLVSSLAGNIEGVVQYNQDHLYLCIFIYGFGIGAWNGANNVILIEMWQEKSPSILQFSQFIYGVGTILGPLLTEKFVIGDQVCPGYFEEEIAFCNITGHYNGTVGAGVTTPANIEQWCDECLNYDRRPDVKIPLLIGGLLQLIGPAMMLVMFFVKRYHFDQSSKVEVVLTEEAKARYKKYVPTKTIIICISLYLAFGIMSENMYMDFAPTFFQYSPAKLKASEASQLFSIMAIGLTVGRGLSVFVAMFLQPWHMIAYQSVIVFAGYIFQFFGQHEYNLLMISSIIICFGYSSIFICLFSFVGQYMEVTDVIGGLFIGSYNAVYMFLPYFIGLNIEEHPWSFIVLEFGCFCIAIVAFIVVMIAVWRVPKDLIRKLRPIAGH